MRQETKICATCGRRFAWRRAWATDWENVRYCSAGCRRHKPARIDAALEAVVITLLARRSPSSSICPSEAAREVAGDDGWRELKERTRRAARRLAARGEVEITQGGRVVDPSDFSGPVRIRRPRR